MVLCSKRLTRFCADRNFEFAIWKLMATTTMASTTGRTPLLPLRTRAHEARRYWPSDWATSSGGTSIAASAAAVRSATIVASAAPAGVSLESAVTSDTGHAPTTAPRQHVDEHRGEEHAAGQDVLQRCGQTTQAEQGYAVGDAADEEAAEHTVEGLTPAAEEADPADDGGRDGVQDKLTGVGRVGAVLTVEEGAEQDAAESGGRRAQREGPGADAGDADAGAAGRLGVAADGIEVAAEADPPEHERPDAEHDEDDRDHPRNSLHRLEGGSAVDIADRHHSYPDERHQGDSDCRHTHRGSHQALASPPGRAQPQGRAGGPDHHRQNDPAGHRGDHPLDQVVDDALVELRRVEVHGAVGAAEDDDEDSRKKKEPAQGHDEGRDLEPGSQRPLEGAEHSAGDERGEYGCPPRPAWPGLLHQF